MRHTPIVLGIVGNSASGKTTLTRGVSKILGQDRVAVICIDDYLKYSRVDRVRSGKTEQHPESYYLDVAEQHLRLLKSGEAVLKPGYNHSTGELGKPEYIEPKQFIIVEGRLAYYNEALRNNIDIKVFLDPPEQLRARWKLQCDKVKRANSTEDIRKEMAASAADAETFVRPQKRWADMVVSFHAQSRLDQDDTQLSVSSILRPTLPHPDLSGVFEKYTGSPGMHLELDRDMGLPVDRLEIDGEMSDDTARQMENSLLAHIPGERQRIEGIGKFTGRTGESLDSRPLALLQLLIALHVFKCTASYYSNK